MASERPNSQDPGRLLKILRSYREIRLEIDTLALEHKNLSVRDSRLDPVTISTRLTEIRDRLQIQRQRLSDLGQTSATVDPRCDKHRVGVESKADELSQALLLSSVDLDRRVEQEVAHDIRIVRPGVSDSEIVDIARHADHGQVYTQALRDARQGGAGMVSRNVRARHDEIQKMTDDMSTLASMFADVGSLLTQQEKAIIDTEANSHDTSERAIMATRELDVATDRARTARRNRSKCLWISVTTFVMVAIVVTILVVIVLKTNHVI